MTRPFLSHQWKDKAIVRRIAADLVSRGMNPVLDVWEFVPGDSLADSMNRGIADANAFVLFWSKHSAVSQNVKYERELGITKAKRRNSFRIICVLLDDTPLPPEHSFRIFVDWRTGRKSGSLFDRNLTLLTRAIMGMPPEPRPLIPQSSSHVSRADATVNAVLDRICANRYIFACRSKGHRFNPITGVCLDRDTIYDQIALVATQGEIVVLDYDESRMGEGYVCLPSYRLVDIAVGHPAFSEYHEYLEKGFEAYHMDYKSRNARTQNPWHKDGDGGALFLANAALQLQRPVVAILRWVNWSPQEGGERMYRYADELPALKTEMSVIVDVSDEADIAKAKWLFDFEISDHPSDRRLIDFRQDPKRPKKAVNRTNH